MADTSTDETVTPEALSNESSTPTAPVTDNGSADVEQAKREAEQARLRANQLQNQLDKIKAEQEAAQKTQLEEKEEYKTLYESTQQKLTQIESEKQQAELKAQLTAATDTVFKDYPAEVVDLAKTAGLSLSDDSEAATTALKEKLDAFKAKVAPSAPTVTSNNPHSPASGITDRQELVTKGADGVSPMALAGARGDETVARQYVGSLSAIKEMKRMAGIKVD